MHPHIARAIHHIKTSKRELLVQIFLVFFVPILLIHLGIVPVSMRVPVLILLVSGLGLVLLKENWTWKMLGIERKTTRRYILQYVTFTVIGVAALSIFGEHIGREEITRWWMHRHFLYMFFIVSVFQEVAYRGYLIPALGKIIENPIWIVVFNALIFMYLHSIFPFPQISLPLAFIGGIGFAVMYIRYPSLPLIILAHSVLNFCALLYGFFAIPGVTF